MTTIHIVTLNIPYPPDYGGMIDSFCRIKRLKELGVKIHLHCFEYGRAHSTELESLCETVNYYKRQSILLTQFSSIPCTVLSRRSDRLIENLTRDKFPILFDGLHSTYYINHPGLKDRKKFIRLHNIEHKYYRSLASNEKSIVKKFYFNFEANKLKKYEKKIAAADYLFPISDDDQVYYSAKYKHSALLAPFHPFDDVISNPGTGEYIIYHGDLSVNENRAVAEYLILNIFSRISYNCVIAGKEPSDDLISLAGRYDNVKIVADPENEEMLRLIGDAQINILPALASNGFKLKIIMALYAGRHCIVNPVIGGNLATDSLCHVVSTSEEILSTVDRLMKQPFTSEMITERRKVLSDYFDSKKNAAKLLEFMQSAES